VPTSGLILGLRGAATVIQLSAFLGVGTAASFQTKADCARSSAMKMPATPLAQSKG